MNKVKQHSVYGASSSNRYLNCAGSVALIKKAPPQRDSPFAQEGTLAHECLEFIVKDSSAANVKLAKIKYPQEMVEHALEALIWLKSKLETIPGGKVLCETKVDAAHFTRPGEFGTLDLAIVAPFDKLVVVDYKYGAGHAVDPEENTQMIYYALALLKKYDYNFSSVDLVIRQPRAWHPSGKTTRIWTTTVQEIRKWENTFANGVKACETPNAPLKAGDWCKFCPAGVICPEVKNKSLRAAQVAFSDETGVEKLPEPTQIAIPNLGTILSACDKIETWIEKVREHALHVLERGHKVEGFRLVQKRSVRKYTNIAEASLVAFKSFGDRAFSNPELLSPAQLEMKVGKEHVEEFLKSHVSDVSSGYTIVSDTDKREAVNPVAEVFKELEKLKPVSTKAKQLKTNKTNKKGKTK